MINPAPLTMLKHCVCCILAHDSQTGTSEPPGILTKGSDEDGKTPSASGKSGPETVYVDPENLRERSGMRRARRPAERPSTDMQGVELEIAKEASEGLSERDRELGAPIDATAR
mmetsp:Transcript_6776/g.12415  ORF Transcript_6776/g.12415 Transcript_6776/m.12415 type:complete len:114 (+) Transcript_6776:428-769(+)